MAGKQGLKRGENPLRLLDGCLKRKEFSNLRNRMSGTVRRRQFGVDAAIIKEGHDNGYDDSPTCPGQERRRK
jgi:hypothetical protein